MFLTAKKNTPVKYNVAEREGFPLREMHAALTHQAGILRCGLCPYTQMAWLSLSSAGLGLAAPRGFSEAPDLQVKPAFPFLARLLLRRHYTVIRNSQGTRTGSLTPYLMKKANHLFAVDT